jgi:structural maintenance of chromosome 4
LVPWTSKINAAQAKLDVAKGEREMLAAKAEGVTKAVNDAQEQFSHLNEQRTSKVTITPVAVQID